LDIEDIQEIKAPEPENEIEVASIEPVELIEIGKPPVGKTGWSESCAKPT
jgi:hypothetical protein